MRRILVLRGGALGDFIVTLPALALLRRRWPAARIELTGNSTAAQLALSATPNPGPSPKKCHLMDDTSALSRDGVSGKCHPLDDTRAGTDAPREGAVPALLDAVHS